MLEITFDAEKNMLLTSRKISYKMCFFSMRSYSSAMIPSTCLIVLRSRITALTPRVKGTSRSHSSSMLVQRGSNSRAGGAGLTSRPTAFDNPEVP